ncbi:MAG TPA: alpha/beta hydrolase-fold protein [Puia sp.]|jgi:enterochelin esterase-like enzyme|nr:alpha/beta hydrolase-fold protein [Puia sp.]
MNRILLIGLLIISFSCKRIKQTDDSLYSRHLQRTVKLHILHTPPPSDRSLFNLLILNDGQDMEKLHVKETMDSLYKEGKLLPIVIIGVEAGDRMQEYGVADKPDYLGRGNRAGLYDAFINDELYPYAKKESGVRKFQSFVIAGCSLGGLSAFDIAWNHPDKISKVGVFSGSFWWRDKSSDDSTYSDEKNRIMYSKLKASRKKPGLQYWFYAGAEEEKSDRDKDSIIDVIDDTKDIINLLEKKNVVTTDGIVYRELPTGIHDYSSWSIVFPEFLIWAFPAN